MAAIAKDVEAPVTIRKLSINAEEVREAIEIEHTLTFWEAANLYPKAIGWSCYFSLGVIMLGKLKSNLSFSKV
jgi:SP family general alpha glucoside:H+ symporter-like MFS transporter